LLFNFFNYGWLRLFWLLLNYRWLGFFFRLFFLLLGLLLFLFLWLRLHLLLLLLLVFIGIWDYVLGVRSFEYALRNILLAGRELFQFSLRLFY
jgi:hypothetical protein